MRTLPLRRHDGPAQGLGPRVGRLPALDGLRGLAILGVMICHQTQLEPVAGPDAEFRWIVQFLQMGVDLFFVLSGYLITNILLESKEGPHYYRNFFTRRILRIFPLYYAILFVGLVILPRMDRLRPAKWPTVDGLGSICYWSFQSNWWIALRGYGPINGLIDLSWTLSIEEQFYLLWPFVVRWCRPRQLVSVCVSLVASAFLFRLALVCAGAPPLWAHMMTPARWDALAVGAWIALIAGRPSGHRDTLGAARRIALGAAAALAVLIPASRYSSAASAALSAAGGSFAAAACGGLLIVAASARPGTRAARILGAGPLRTLGFYSYGLYLFHVPILGLIREKLYRPSEFLRLGESAIPGQLLFYIAATVPALGCAWLSWHLFEGPILGLKRYFPTGADPIGRDRSARSGSAAALGGCRR